MLQLLEFVPIVLFFVVYKMDGETLSFGGFEHQVDGIFSATAVLIVATLLQVVMTYLVTRKLEKRLLWLAFAVILFGGATLFFRDESFIQLKPTVFNWVLALVFIGFQYIGDRNLIERTLGGQIELPKPIWARLNTLWITNFIVVGALNLLVAYNFSEEAWVDYKLYSAIGFTLLLTIISAIMIGPHVSEVESTEPQLPGED